jgi:hypothetical protein
MGSGIGVAIVTALLNGSPVRANISVAGTQVAHHQVIPQVFADRGYVVGFWMIAAFTLVSAVIALLMRHGRAPATGGEHEFEHA